MVVQLVVYTGYHLSSHRRFVPVPETHPLADKNTPTTFGVLDCAGLVLHFYAT